MRDKLITFKVTERERRRFVMAARLTDTDLSTYLRRCCERLADLVEDAMPPGETLDTLAARGVDVDAAIDAAKGDLE